MKITVTTDTGHRAELTTTTAVDGTIVARASAYWRGVRTPPIELKSFADPGQADRYLRRLAAALVDRDALEETPPKHAIRLDPIVCKMNEEPHLLTACCYEWRLPT